MTPNRRRDIDDEAMPVAALLLALGTFFFFGVMDTVAKVLVIAGLAPVFVVWCRFAGQTVVYLVLRRAWRNPEVFRVRNLLLQTLRGLALPLATLFNFAALQTLQLAETATIFLASPMMVTALSGPILGEWAGPRRWAAIIVGFIGVMFVVRPGTSMFTLPILWSVGCMVSYSVYSILTRKLAGTESHDSLLVYAGLFGAVLLAPFALQSASLPDNPVHLALLAGIGVIGLLGHNLLVRASRIASAGKVAPFVYSQLLWMTAFGFVLFGDVPDGYTITGATIICASGLYIMLRERTLARERQKSAA